MNTDALAESHVSESALYLTELRRRPTKFRALADIRLPLYEMQMYGFRTEVTRRKVQRWLAAFAFGFAVHLILTPFAPKVVADNVSMVAMLAALLLQTEPRGPLVARAEWIKRAAWATLSGLVVTVAFRLLDAAPRLVALLWR